MISISSYENNRGIMMSNVWCKILHDPRGLIHWICQGDDTFLCRVSSSIYNSITTGNFT